MGKKKAEPSRLPTTCHCRGNWTPYLYVLPAVMLSAIFVVYPVIYNLLQCFQVIPLSFSAP